MKISNSVDGAIRELKECGEARTPDNQLVTLIKKALNEMDIPYEVFYSSPNYIIELRLI